MQQCYKLLLDVLSNNLQTRQFAENELSKFRSVDFHNYIVSLLGVLTDVTNDNIVVSQTAGVILKNAFSFSSRTPYKYSSCRREWSENLNNETRQQIKSRLLYTFIQTDDTNLVYLKTLSQVISKIACFELITGWPEFYQLLEESKVNGALQFKFLLLISYVLEDFVEIHDRLPSEPFTDTQILSILDFILKMLSTNNSNLIQLSLKSLCSAVYFAPDSFSSSGDVEIIFKVLNNHLISKDIEVRLSAWEMLINLVETYYDELANLMSIYASYTFFTMLQTTGFDSIDYFDNEDIKAQILTHESKNSEYFTAEQIETCRISAVEFWHLIADEESYRKKQNKQFTSIIDHYAPKLIPILCWLTRTNEQEYDDCDDAYTIQKASCAALKLIIELTDNKYSDLVINYVRTTIIQENTFLKVSSLYSLSTAFCITNQQKIKAYLNLVLRVVLEYMNNPNLAVREAASYVMGSITRYQLSSLKQNLAFSNNSLNLVQFFLMKLHDDQRVVKHICCILYNIFSQYRIAFGKLQYDLEKNAEMISKNILDAAAAIEKDNNEIRTQLFNVLYILINKVESGPYINQFLEILFNKLLIWLDETTNLVYSYDVARLQQSYTATLNNVIKKLGRACAPKLEQLFTTLIRVLQHGSQIINGKLAVWSECTQDVFFLFENLLLVYGEELAEAVPIIVNFIKVAISNPENETEISSTSIGLVSTLSSTVPKIFKPFAVEIISMLGHLIVNDAYSSELRPITITTLSDLALAYEPIFAPNLVDFMTIIEMALASNDLSSIAADEPIDEYIIKLQIACYNALSVLLYNEKCSEPNSPENQKIVSILKTAYKNIIVVCKHRYDLDFIVESLNLIYDSIKTLKTSICNYMLEIELLDTMLVIIRKYPDTSCIELNKKVKNVSYTTPNFFSYTSTIYRLNNIFI